MVLIASITSNLARLLPIVFAVLALVFSPANAAKKAALVIGNGAYQHSPKLTNPANDAGDVALKLQTLGFEVIAVTDGSQRAILDALSRFGRAASGADVAMVFYAGHGVQVAGRNWLLPVTANVQAETDLPSQAIRMNDLMDVMEASGAKVKLVFMDACRNNPLPKAATRSASRGLARIQADTAGTLIAFATAPATVAEDGTGRNSPFTTALLRHIATPNLEIRQMIGRVRENVYETTNKRQLPWVNEALIGEFYFAGKGANSIVAAPEPQPAIPAPQQAAPAQPAGPSEKEMFDLAKSINNPGAWNAFLTKFPNGTYAPFAKAALDKLKPTSAPPKSVETQTALSIPSEPQPQPESDTRGYGGFFFPDSHQRRLTSADLAGLSRAQLRVARNEIFARRGRHFKSADLRAHFGQFGWYNPRTWNPRLNRIEKWNVNFIKRHE